MTLLLSEANSHAPLIFEVQATGSFLSTTPPETDQPYQHQRTSRGATSLSLSLHAHRSKHQAMAAPKKTMRALQYDKYGGGAEGLKVHYTSTTQPPAAPVVRGQDRRAFLDALVA